MRSVAIALDGVLRKPLDAEAQDMGGALLYRALSEQFRVVVMGSADYERDKQWMLLQGLTGYVKIEPLTPEDRAGYWNPIYSQLRRLRAEGFKFEFVVTPDPGFAPNVLELGMGVLVYAHPQFSPPSARRVTPWTELDSRVRADRRARAEAAAE